MFRLPVPVFVELVEQVLDPHFVPTAFAVHLVLELFHDFAHHGFVRAFLLVLVGPPQGHGDFLQRATAVRIRVHVAQQRFHLLVKVCKERERKMKEKKRKR